MLKLGDLTDQKSEAIVNAANSKLIGGGGVDGAIHRKGGKAILEECLKITKQMGACEVGHAVITSGGNLNARFVIHTVGPFWNGGNRGEEEKLSQCYVNSLSLARERGIKTIFFPSISTGAYRFPLERAAKIAQKTVVESILMDEHFIEVGFVLFDERTYRVYLEVFSDL